MKRRVRRTAGTCPRMSDAGRTIHATHACSARAGECEQSQRPRFLPQCAGRRPWLRRLTLQLQVSHLPLTCLTKHCKCSCKRQMRS